MRIEGGPDRIWTPWSHSQVESLNAFQESGVVHRFTCVHCGTDLVAGQMGWVCPRDDYRQAWAYRWMANWTWRDLLPLTGPRLFVVRTATGTNLFMNATELEAWSRGHDSFQVTTLRP